MSTQRAQQTIDALLAEYYGVEVTDMGPIGRLLRNEEQKLLAGILLETRAMRNAQGVSNIEDIIDDDYSTPEGESEGVYASYSLSLSANQWYEIDLDFTSEEVDIRHFETPIQVRFRDSSSSEYTIQYKEDEQPVIGIPVRTSEVWIRPLDADTNITVDIWTEDYS